MKWLTRHNAWTLIVPYWTAVRAFEIHSENIFIHCYNIDTVHNFKWLIVLIPLLPKQKLIVIFDITISTKHQSVFICIIVSANPKIVSIYVDRSIQWIPNGSLPHNCQNLPPDLYSMHQITEVGSLRWTFLKKVLPRTQSELMVLRTFRGCLRSRIRWSPTNLFWNRSYFYSPATKGTPKQTSSGWQALVDCKPGVELQTKETGTYETGCLCVKQIFQINKNSS